MGSAEKDVDYIKKAYKRGKTLRHAFNSSSFLKPHELSLNYLTKFNKTSSQKQAKNNCASISGPSGKRLQAYTSFASLALSILSVTDGPDVFAFKGVRSVPIIASLQKKQTFGKK